MYSPPDVVVVNAVCPGHLRRFHASDFANAFVVKRIEHAGDPRRNVGAVFAGYCRLLRGQPAVGVGPLGSA